MTETTGRRILMITPFAPPNLGGAETHLQDLYEYLTDNDYRITLLTYQPLTTKARGLPYEELKNLKTHRYLLYGNNLFHKLENWHPVFNFSYLTPHLFLRSLLFMARYYREIEVIHVFGLAAAFIARFLKMFFHKPIIMSTETIYNFNTRSVFSFVSRWVLGGFDKILVHSEDSKMDILRLNIDEKKLRVYTHWINLNNFKPRDKLQLRKELGWRDKFTVLYVGRLIPMKGIRVFLEAAFSTDKDIDFKIIGDDGPELNVVLSAQNKSRKIKFVGKVPYERLPLYYAASDVFVYPALYEEDVARVLIESMACGTPVINTNKGSGIYELNEKVAFVTPPTREAIQEKIEYLFDHPDVLREMSAAAVVFAQKFGPVLGKTITAAYEEVLAPRGVK